MNRIKTIILSSAITLVVSSVVFALILNPSKNKDKSYFSSLINDTSKQSTEYTAQKQQSNNSISDDRNTIITKTVKEVSPAVVGITVTEIRQYRDIFSMDPFFRQFFGDRVYNQKIQGLGSGAIISKYLAKIVFYMN